MAAGLVSRHHPLWPFGGAALIGAFVLRAVALHNGSLSVVQTLLMTDLVYAVAVGGIIGTLLTQAALRHAPRRGWSRRV